MGRENKNLFCDNCSKLLSGRHKYEEKGYEADFCSQECLNDWIESEIIHSCGGTLGENGMFIPNCGNKGKCLLGVER